MENGVLIFDKPEDFFTIYGNLTRGLQREPKGE